MCFLHKDLKGVSEAVLLRKRALLLRQQLLKAQSQHQRLRQPQAVIAAAHRRLRKVGVPALLLLMAILVQNGPHKIEPLARRT